MNDVPVVYGIKSCDTVRKATRWLDSQNISYKFVDFKIHPPSQAQALEWLQQIGAEALINRRSTTWRALDDSQKQLDSHEALAELLMAHPTLIKRPLLVYQEHRGVGFSAEQYEALFKI